MSSMNSTPSDLNRSTTSAVVNYLVVAVHGWFEGPDHPRKCLDGHLHASAKSLVVMRAEPSRRSL